MTAKKKTQSADDDSGAAEGAALPESYTEAVDEVSKARGKDRDPLAKGGEKSDASGFRSPSPEGFALGEHEDDTADGSPQR